MTSNQLDLIWNAMSDGELYTTKDLASKLGQPTETVGRILHFLAQYGFTEHTMKHRLFRKRLGAPSPGDAARILRTLVRDDGGEDADRIGAPSGVRERSTRL